MSVARAVYALATKLPKEETYGMRSQITGAAVSVPSNIAEGWTRNSKKEKGHFFAIAQASLAETETLLTLCEDFRWFTMAESQDLRGYIDEVSRMLTVMRRKWRVD
ncbi:four helix bundle protein [bacterium]|nr:four helix bundle protein [bacterium]